ncbi:lung seven transmembrane receptor-domain-containing protein [Neocallimastix lanati (nom. inval.)]|jgi:heme/copper-type cytochrome/quinol oxidase subunit 2|nr:lung seven transmembrane receptor-domain-containing protein [Neocallimastix sp. JGI-2020a]
MKGSNLFILFFCLLPSFVFSLSEQLNCKANEIYSQYGIIVNEKKNAYISIEVTKPQTTGYNITMIAIVCNILDLDNIGYNKDNKKYLICSDPLIEEGKCNKENEIIVDEKNLKGKVLTKLFSISDKTDYPYNTDLKYDVEETGFYSVILKPANDDEYDSSYDLVSNIEWHSSTGELPGGDYPKVKFYGILALVYTVICGLWILNAYIYRQDILPIQHYITGINVFVTTEMIMHYIYYKHYNNTNENSMLLLIFAGGLNAGRNSLTFFILLIVCMGYGVVKQSLGSTMRKVQFLTLFHFIFGVLYAIGLMIVSEITEFVVLFFVFPLSATMTIFYVWTLAALTNSINKLEQRHQEAKLNMFLNLRKILIICILLIFAFFITSSFNFMGSQDIQWIVEHWATRWFWIDGFLNLIYLFGFTSIIFLWRPTANNQRYGLDQLPSDDIDEIDLDEHFVNQPSEGVVPTENSHGKKNVDDITVGFDFGSGSENEDDIGPESNEDVYKWAEENIDIKVDGNSEISKDDNLELYDNLEVHIDNDEEKLI